MSSFLIYQPVCSFVVCSSCLMELWNKITMVFLISFVLADFFSWNLSVPRRPTAAHPWGSSSVWLSGPQAANHPPFLAVLWLLSQLARTCCICDFCLTFTSYIAITSPRSYLPLNRMQASWVICIWQTLFSFVTGHTGFYEFWMNGQMIECMHCMNGLYSSISQGPYRLLNKHIHESLSPI